MIRRAAFVLLALCAPVLARSQSMHGTMTDADAQPLPGVVVAMLDTAGHVVARQLSTAAGTWRLRAPSPGAYRVQTRRIGYLPTLSAPLLLGATDEARLDVTLTRLHIALDTVRVMAQGACAVTDSSSTTFTLWDQLRAALAATSATTEDATIESKIMAYDQLLDPSTLATQWEDVGFHVDHGQQPWSSLGADSLRRVGYVERGPRNATVFHAPGLDALMSATFLADHCIHLVDSVGHAGIAFEPTRDRRRVAEIRGTLWFDRRTIELGSMDFRYVNVPRDQDGAGGSMSFAKLDNGLWLISRWEIRMPELGQRSFVGGAGTYTAMERTYLRDVKVRGGSLIHVRRGADTLWTTTPLILIGTVMDSLSLDPLPNVSVTVAGTTQSSISDGDGRFTIFGLLPGEYILDLKSPSLDSVSMRKHYALTLTKMVPVEIHLPSPAYIAASFCTSPTLTSGGGSAVITGNVGVPPGVAPGAITVSADWTDLTGRRLHSVVCADGFGDYALCTLPRDTEITLRASMGAVSSAASLVSVPPSLLVARVDLIIPGPG